MNFVAEELGVAFVPGPLQKTRVKGVVFKAIDDPSMIDLFLLWRSANANPCIPGFLDQCAELAPARRAETE